MSKRITVLAALLVLTTPAIVAAQGHATMPTPVKPDRITIGTEFVPRFLNAPKRLVVPAGATFELAADATWDVIEVAGTARCAPDHDTILRFVHFIILPGGTLECGTVAAPMTRHVEFIVRNVPIDTTVDPFQWANGLLNFGTQTRVGLEKTSRVATAGALAAGQTMLTLAEAPSGWQIGDEVLIPDTRMQDENHFPLREAPLTIVTIRGPTLELSKGLDFDHPLITEPDGTVRGFPVVANLTRNIVVRSEQPDPTKGTPGHTVNVGTDTHWIIRSNRLVGLGRTTNAKIDRTSPDLAHIGTNQIARYGEHEHFANGFGSVLANNVVVGNRVAKWAVVVHQTHDTTVEDNISVDYAGAGFVTEDGVEVRNVFRKNLAAYVLTATTQVDNTTTNLTEGRPGTEGTGYWFHGVQQIFEDNEARNNRIGSSFVNQLLASGSYPSAPGLLPDTPYTGEFARMAVPVSNARNRHLANFLSGNEQWGVAANTITDLLAAYSGNVQFFNFATGFPNLVRPILVAQKGVSSCIHAGMAYTQGLRVEGGALVGCAQGLSAGGGATTTTFLGTKMQNAENFDFRFWGARVDLNDVIIRPLTGTPSTNIVLGFGKRWDGQEPLPFDGAGHLPPVRGSQFFIRNWNGVAGNDYLLFENKQLATEPAPYTKSDSPQHAYALPEVGLTVGQGWAKYGLAERGEALADADKIALEGLVNGWARKGLTSTLGPPSAVLMSPTMREPAPTEDRGVKLYVALTGNYAQADPQLYYAIDGGPTVAMDQQPGQPLDGREFFGPGTAGTHTIILSRKDVEGQGVINTRTFQYFVGAQPPPCTTCDCNPALCPKAPAAPTLATPLRAGDSVVRGSGASGAIVQVFVNARAVGEAPADGAGAFARTVSPLVGGQIVTATQTVGGLTSALSAAVTVTAIPPPTIPVPNVVGQTEADAEKSLVFVGLVKGTVTRVTNAAPAGQVLTQSPTAAQQVLKGSAVSLVLSSGPIIQPPPTPTLLPAGTYRLCNAAGVCVDLVVK